MTSVQAGRRGDQVPDLRPRAAAVTAREAPSDLADGGELTVVEAIQRPRLHANTAPQPVRVLIADGQALLRAGFRLLLEADRRIAVVGEAATGEQVVALARCTRPDVVLIDVRLPGLDSVEATGRISAESGPSVMLLVASADDERTFAGLRAGASGALVKDTEPAELVRAVEMLARGEVVLSPAVTRHLIAEFASQPQREDPSPKLLDALTAREREIVALVALGLSNGEIAERLVISPATAKTHVSRAMLKLHACDRAKLVVLAYKAGLVAPRANAGARAPAGCPLALATVARG
jgi:DNA-binding NarL/FixJ family response regulator